MEISSKDGGLWLSTTLENIREAAIGLDRAGAVVWMNPAAERLTGRKEKQTRGLPLTSFFEPLDRETRTPVQVPIASMGAAGTTVSEQNRMLITYDNRTSYIDYTIVPVSGDGEYKGMLLLVSGHVFESDSGAAGTQVGGTRKTSVHGRNRCQRVLVMDDDDMVRTMTIQKLIRLGYESEGADNGEDAIAKFKTARDTGRPFDVVVLDLVVRGGMGGKDTVEMLRRIDPEVRAVLTSGHAADPILTNFWEYGFLGVIRKPFVIKELDLIIRQVLE